MTGRDNCTNVNISIDFFLVIALGLSYLGFRFVTHQGAAEVKIENQQPSR